MRFLRFFHKLFKPNCTCYVCELPKCANCEFLNSLLQQEQANNRALLNAILEFNKPLVVNEEAREVQDPKPIHTSKRQNFAVIRSTLEARDKAIAEEERAAKSIRIKQSMNSVPIKTEEEMFAILDELNVNNG